MRFLQTFILPNETVRRFHLSFAASNFSRNLIASGAFDKVYSLIPVNVRGELGEISESGYEVLYSKCRYKGGLLAKFSIFIEQWRIYKHIKKNDSIWFYNLNVINIFLFLLLKLFKPSVKRNVIVLDFSPSKNLFSQNYWGLKCINSADGKIFLSYSSLFRRNNSITIPGITPSEINSNPKIEIADKSFLLSGVISNNISLTRRVLTAFGELPECTLYITGSILEDDRFIKEFAATHSNIKLLGTVSFDQYLKILHQVTFLLSTRNPEAPENQCNFPSKIIEALLHNRIVVSTIHYEQLDGIRYFTVSSDKEGMIHDLQRIADLPQSELLSYANQGEEVRRRFNVKVWNEAIQKLEQNSDR